MGGKLKDSEFEGKKRSAIVQCERGLVFNAWEIGRHLKDLSAKGINIKSFMERGSHSFSYERSMAFKRFYEESLTNTNLDVKILGVDKTLAIIEPLKADSGEFLLRYPQEKLEEMNVEEVRDEAQNFLGEKKHLSKSILYFQEAENDFFDLVGVFGGAVSGKYRGDYLRWDGRERVLRLLDKLKKILEGLK